LWRRDEEVCDLVGEEKLVPVLGTKFPVFLEVLDWGERITRG